MESSTISGSTTRQGSTLEGIADMEKMPRAVLDLPAPKDEEQSSTGTVFGPPPNGGLKAWVQVLACYFLFFNTW